ncbi:S-layer homology domain-containing protein [Paenibacillus solisilvae]|uniref:S-layer homology domain-containing protein n=1 Tax=Paenibacillus solisilvae TaxID=2486751 RepID=A0ABW0VWY9_9BACL
MKKVLAAMLVLLFVLSPVSSYAAASFALDLSAQEVLRGDEITLSGTASNDVVVKIVRPNDTVFYLDVIEPANGIFSATITIPDTEDFAPYGVYKTVASSGSATLNKSFNVVDKLGGGGTTPGNGNGTVTPPTDTGTIPADAGSTSGSVIQPDKAKDGTYIFGGDTLTSAIEQALDSVTIELPVSTGTSGNALEFPAQALKTLMDKDLDLIVISDNGTVRFLAGAIAAPSESGQSTNIRIVLNTVLTDDAKNAINGTLQSNTDYASTGVVISVVIQVHSGNNVSEVHNLDKPAVVNLKLTKEQEQLIDSDLAGVYYVNGKQLEYVGGTVSNGTLTFQANHFSYYTILEYNKTFADLNGHWAEKPVKSLTAKHILNGVDKQHYAPSRNITRAEFTTMIMRSIEWTGNADVQAGTNPFKDVPAGRYYTDAVAQAASLGIVSGYEGAFRPNDKITREEAVVALVRAAKYFELSSPGKGAPAFADAKDISAWATAAVDEAWSKGLIEGDGKQFNPKKSVTRAEVAVMINRLLPVGSV